MAYSGGDIVTEFKVIHCFEVFVDLLLFCWFVWFIFSGSICLSVRSSASVT